MESYSKEVILYYRTQLQMGLTDKKKGAHLDGVLQIRMLCDVMIHDINYDDEECSTMTENVFLKLCLKWNLTVCSIKLFLKNLSLINNVIVDL